MGKNTEKLAEILPDFVIGHFGERWYCRQYIANMFKFKKKYSNVQVQTEVEMFEVPIEVELFKVHGLDACPANNFLFKVAI